MRDAMHNDKPPASPIEPGLLPLAKAPDTIWKSIEAALDVKEKPSPFHWWQFAAASFAILAIGAYWFATRPPKPSWEVARLDGSPSVGSRVLGDAGKLQVGEWLQTGASSRARITVGNIGSVEVEPNTRVRLVTARPNENRLTLAHGEISAVVSAPPRLFFVDTPSSTAVDLGCAYKMKVDGDGTGLLRVTLGWVSLEWKGRESMVPAGASCRTRHGVGPGTPFFDDAPEPWQQALTAFDFASGGVDSLLANARVRDTLTLWHLLSRVRTEDRQRVFDRMVQLVPLPASVSREKALQLDPDTLKLWREELAWKW